MRLMKRRLIRDGGIFGIEKKRGARKKRESFIS